MRIRSLPPLALILGATLCGTAQASGDDACYPVWTLLRDSLDACNNLAFLNPGNDSRVNLRLLLADRHALALKPAALTDDELSEGYGPVPFPVARLEEGEIEGDESEESGAAALNDVLERLGIPRDSSDSAGQAFLQGEGSRCRSNRDDSAADFIGHLLETPALPDTERQALARSRLQLLESCTWDGEKLAALLPAQVQSDDGKAFLAYLQAAADFYSGRFSQAESRFASLSESSQPWLKETALYMVARTRLNDAQRDAFDEYGTIKSDLDPAPFNQVSEALTHYLTAYPEGRYARSAKGLMRRAHWLAGDLNALAKDYDGQLMRASADEGNLPADDLIQETDNKLLMASTTATPSSLLTATVDLMLMRADAPRKLTREELLAQKDLFAEWPAMFDYLQAVFAFYLDKQPDQALKNLPRSTPTSLDALAFSQQTLRGLALEANGDLAAAQRLWQELMPLASQPLQRDQLELALAMNYERSGQLTQVFASDSPIQSAQVRSILLSKVADAPLLRQQITQGNSDTEKATAQFVLLYKNLLHQQYAAFAEDLKTLPAQPADTRLGTSLGYVYGEGQTLQLFRWKGDKAESGYSCPSVAETAALLQANAQDPKGLNCLGEFILRNGLDGIPLDDRPSASLLGSSQPGFEGPLFSRLDGYRTVIADSNAPRDEKAYALFRAINCYAPSGYNSCGGKDVEPSVRKGWFRQLKSTYAATPWGQSLQYYW
ncbi:outer membrane assembly lipoprotein YfiO [Pseudomonas sp. GD03842]|uniref:outer membrane assembly lipoprotein YfiO n=1 Tax=Pseudomonas sp. GD03842 TaxID=2975385 RepID=UPI00244735D2|nr:outer membrane assembly lipoprotein YfiO [Pseudomonas sp. GD03842]MDH0745514.1 outer membrane assembly lipoprotein YfiO [Pseudomonas sp. GD03842]